METQEIIDKIISGSQAASGVAKAIAENAAMAGATVAGFKEGLNGGAQARPINDIEVSVTSETKIFVGVLVAAILFVIIKKRK